MLAYELFLKNKDNENEFLKRVVPIKKVFVKIQGLTNLKIDEKTLEEYGYSPEQKDIVRETLLMPLNDQKSVGLPLRATGSASKKPYVEFYCTYGRGKLNISVQGEKKASYKYVINFENNAEEVRTGKDSLILRLDKKNYFVQDATLFEAYREAGIISTNGMLSSELFLKVCRDFVSFCKERNISEKLRDIKGNKQFRIIVLPYSLMSDNLRIEFREDTNAGFPSTLEFEDAFGSIAREYPSKTTMTAKFLSFDDQAFTINCRTGKEFYQNLGIGDSSFSKINMPTDSGFRKSGLTWYFFDITDRFLKFEKLNSGIYNQLFRNYQQLLHKAGSSVERESVMKIICVKEAQAKLEVLLDENLTFDQLKDIFDIGEDDFSRHPMALESFIIQRKTGILWSDYIVAVRSFITGTFLERSFLIQHYVRIIREKLWDWTKGDYRKTNPKTFFEQSEFCLKLLTHDGKKGLIMNKNEEYAYKIGLIAGKYVKFKRDTKEANNSTNDILTYSKYDREKLRYVYRRICLGISLSKTNDNRLEEITRLTKTEEIEDAKANEDYSYFFYKGVFENL